MIIGAVEEPKYLNDVGKNKLKNYFKILQLEWTKTFYHDKDEQIYSRKIYNKAVCMVIGVLFS